MYKISDQFSNTAILNEDSNMFTVSSYTSSEDERLRGFVRPRREESIRIEHNGVTMYIFVENSHLAINIWEGKMDSHDPLEIRHCD